MKWFSNLKIKTKLLISFIVIAIFTAVLGVVGVNNMKKINTRSEDMYNNNFIPVQNLQKIQINLQSVRANHILLAFERNPSKYQTTINEIDALIKDSNELLDKYEKTIDKDDEKERSLYNNVVASLTDYREIRDKNLALIGEQKYDEAIAEMAEVTAVRVKTDEEVEKLVNYNIELASKTVNTNQENFKVQTISMIIIIVIVFLVALILGVAIANMISNPINEMVKAADRMAVGDVNVNIKSDTEDEVGSLGKSFERMIGNIRSQALVAERIADGDLTVNVDIRSDKDLLGKKLSEMVEKNNEVLLNISTAADQVAAGASQISQSSIAISQGATEQASSIEELTASVEQIAAQTKLNANNANLANELAESAKTNAMEGNSQMKDMLKAM